MSSYQSSSKYTCTVPHMRRKLLIDLGCWLADCTLQARAFNAATVVMIDNQCYPYLLEHVMGSRVRKNLQLLGYMVVVFGRYL